MCFENTKHDLLLIREAQRNLGFTDEAKQILHRAELYIISIIKKETQVTQSAYDQFISDLNLQTSCANCLHDEQELL